MIWFRKTLITILSVYLCLPFQTTWAADKCPDSVQAIEKGQASPCDGLLFSEDASRKADEAIQDAKYYKDLSDKLYKRQSYVNEQIDTLDQRLKLYVDQSNVLAKELTAKQNEDKWQKLVYFSLGIIATGIAVHGAAELGR